MVQARWALGVFKSHHEKEQGSMSVSSEVIVYDLPETPMVE
jgi:hypothetical protein